MTTAAVVAAVVVFWAALLPPAPLRSGGSPDPTSSAAPSPARSMSTARSRTASRRDPRSRPRRREPVCGSSCSPTTAMPRVQPEAPSYASGVLCIDAVEISTDGGHYVALGLPRAPYRLGGDAAGVAEDVRRLGGFGIVAHPDSPRPALAWHDWRVEADGVEWLNADSAWRGRSRTNLVRTFLGYLVDPPRRSRRCSTGRSRPSIAGTPSPPADGCRRLRARRPWRARRHVRRRAQGQPVERPVVTRPRSDPWRRGP